MRYKVFWCKDDLVKDMPHSFYMDHGWILCGIHDDGKLEYIWDDEMCPEDATLVRDISPLVKELNCLAARIETLERELAHTKLRAVCAEMST